jgi:hypothetical protein
MILAHKLLLINIIQVEMDCVLIGRFICFVVTELP